MERKSDYNVAFHTIENIKIPCFSWMSSALEIGFYGEGGCVITDFLRVIKCRNLLKRRNRSNMLEDLPSVNKHLIDRNLYERHNPVRSSSGISGARYATVLLKCVGRAKVNHKFNLQPGTGWYRLNAFIVTRVGTHAVVGQATGGRHWWIDS